MNKFHQAREKAKETAGYRERYAMENGSEKLLQDKRNHLLFKYTYSREDPYQDANGAMFDIMEMRWVG